MSKGKEKAHSKPSGLPGSNWELLKKSINVPSANNSAKRSESGTVVSARQVRQSSGSTPEQSRGRVSKRAKMETGSGGHAVLASRANDGEMSGRQNKKQKYAEDVGNRNRAIGGVAAYMNGAQTTGDDKNGESSSMGPQKVPVAVAVPATDREQVVLLPLPEKVKDVRLVEELRGMIAGKNVLNESKRAPGTYIAIDCEMVGTGPMGSQSCLARVSVINYHGHILLDTFVQPRETVTDWRTWISGIRPSDMVGAPQFDSIQKHVAGLCEGRVVVGHALDNDWKALGFSHPGPMMRDTQNCKMLREAAKNKRPGLKKLAEVELGVQIQRSSHSSVTDARATMALYRLYKTEWEQQLRPQTEAYLARAGQGSGVESSTAGQKRKQSPDASPAADGSGNFEDEGGLLHRAPSERPAKRKGKKKSGEEGGHPGGGRKGISSGISQVITHKDGTKEVRGKKGVITSQSGASSGGNWWEERVD